LKKLAIVITHPIQYYAPWFQLLAKEKNLGLKVFYTWSQSAQKVKDSGFGKEIKWDIPLLEGYEYEFVENTSKNPSDQHFFGIKNPNLIKKLEKFQANAILIFGWNFQSHLQVIRYFKNKIPIYFRGDSNLLDERKSLKTLLRRIWLRFVYSHITKAFYVGTNNKNYYLKHGLKQNQLIFAPHAIDNERFSLNFEQNKEQAQIWKKEIGIKENHLTFLFIGKFEEKKAPEILLQIAEKQKDKEISFLFVGNGILEKQLKEKAKNLPNVYFLPFQNQSKMPVVYHLGDVFVLPSKGPFETWGLAVNEAMACSKPIIVSNKVGSAIDLVTENGFIFDAQNISDLEKKLLFFYENKKIISEFGKKSFGIIQNWTFQEICNSIKKELQF
jgi:glycosyltransferase involved in cell wall biosynthesis